MVHSYFPTRYAAIMTTLGRALGLPTRPISTFQSAHDTDQNRAIDKFYTPEWVPIDGKTGDSVWSFHVWAEAFFSRSDTGPKKPTWQVIDATPQERPSLAVPRPHHTGLHHTTHASPIYTLFQTHTHRYTHTCMYTRGHCPHHAQYIFLRMHCLIRN